MVCRARQQHVESTLKAQQLITCMSNILGLPINLSALWCCSCRTFNLQTTSDAQDILKKQLWKHLSESPPSGRQTFVLFFFFKPCYDISFTNKKTAALIPQYGFERNPCLHVLTLHSVRFLPELSAKSGQKSTVKYRCVFDCLWQARTGRTIVKCCKKL